MDMNELRAKIDIIDDQIVQLFCQRMDVAAQIADYKKANNMQKHSDVYMQWSIVVL